MDTRGRFALSLVLQSIWQRLRDRHPELPPATIVPVSGLAVLKGPAGVAIWLPRKPTLLVPDDETAYELLHATLHGAAVLLTYARGRRPRLRGRYTPRFAASALELDLAVEFTKEDGFGTTRLSRSVRLRFTNELDALVNVLVSVERRAAEPGSRRDRRAS